MASCANWEKYFTGISSFTRQRSKRSVRCRPDPHRFAALELSAKGPRRSDVGGDDGDVSMGVAEGLDFGLGQIAGTEDEVHFNLVKKITQG